MAGDLTAKRKERIGQLKLCDFWKKCAGRLLCLPRVEFSLFSGAVLEDVFEGGLEGIDGGVAYKTWLVSNSVP
jgi:hypothetical protein